MRISVALLILIPSFAMTQITGPDLVEPNERASRKKDDLLLYKVVPHIPVSDDWKTFLLFRNDRNEAITIALDFYDSNGNLAEATFFDADGNEYIGSGHDLPVPAFGMNTVEFDTLSDPDLRSIQSFVFAEGEDRAFSVETLLHNFQGPDKVATVGIVDQSPDFNFFLNVDRRADPYTGLQKLRGLAVTNLATDTCFCNAFLWDDFGNPAGADLPLLIEIPPSGKVVDTLANIYGAMDVRLPFGLGVIALECDRQVSAMGLAFELGTPIVGGIPVDYFVLENNKRIVRK